MPEEIKQVLEAIADRHDGVLTAEAVVAAARSKESPLHALFTWDNRAAGDAYRLHEARKLIRSIRIEIRVDRILVEAPYFVRDASLAPAPGYRSLGRLRSDEDAARESAIAELKRATGALARAKIVAAALGMSDEIEAVELQLGILIGRAISAGDSRVAT